jgi:hypothetical protein
MINKRILIIAPYPIVKPQHGGQKRAKAIYDIYRQNFSSVRYTGVFHRGQYPDWGEDDLPIGDKDLIEQIDSYPFNSEIICGEAIDQDIHVRSYLAKFLIEETPDVIHFEQPFAYLGLAPLLRELGLDIKIVYGSQNIEYLLKKRIFNNLNLDEEYFKVQLKKITKLEKELARNANLVLAVNSEDKRTLIGMGAKKVVLVPNGISISKPTKNAMDRIKKIKQEEGIQNIVTFVGSGHPPNWEGFVKLVGDNTSFLPSGTKIIIAGGVSEYFEKEYSKKKEHKNFFTGIHLMGVLEEDDLAALIELSDLIILPITTIRGSNLKTAEAILAQKKIVATPNAFNGFEAFRELPNIYLANGLTEFRKSIVVALSSKYIMPNSKERALSQKVEWDFVLRPMVLSVISVSRQKTFKVILRKLRNIFKSLMR